MSRKYESVVDNLLAKAGLSPQVARTNLVTRVLLIGPPEAKALLEANYKNRPLRTKAVIKYAKMMENGQWYETHQGFGFSKTGRGLDLQHRLHAVIRSGKTIPFLVTEGMEDEAFAGIDRHSRRNLADSLGEERRYCEIVSFLLRLKKGDNSLDTDQDVRSAVDLFRDELDVLFDAGCPNRKVFSSIPVRSAAIYSMAACPGESAETVKRFSDFTNSRTQNFTPLMFALQNQIYGGKLDAIGTTSRIDLFARCCKMFDQRFDSATKMQLDDRYVDVVRLKLTSIIEERTFLG